MHVVNTRRGKKESLGPVYLEKTCSEKEDHPLSPVILRELLCDPFPEPLGSLSNNDYDGHKNVSEFALLQTLSPLFRLVQFIKCWGIFLDLNSKGLYQRSGKEKESRCLVFTSSTKREIRQFHIVVVQRRQRKVQKTVTHV